LNYGTQPHQESNPAYSATPSPGRDGEAWMAVAREWAPHVRCHLAEKASGRGRTIGTLAVEDRPRGAFLGSRDADFEIEEWGHLRNKERLP
jgi:hypothetical protein